MSERGSIFGASDPIALFRAWLSEAETTEPNDPNAIALATVDPSGMPNVRIVLLKEIEPDGFVFYTNYDSAKGNELSASPLAAFVLHWKSLRRQIRVRGRVEREDGPQADRYYASRDLGSRLGAWASEQSRPLADRAMLEERLEVAAQRHGETARRPPNWGGFRVIPTEIEFWQDGAYRLHDRERWYRSEDDVMWDVKRLFP